MKEKLKLVLNVIKKGFKNLLNVVAVTALIATPLMIEKIQTQFIYIHASNNVFLVNDPKGGRATAFRISVDGETFLVTNDHVCSSEVMPPIDPKDVFKYLFGLLPPPKPTKIYHPYLLVNYGYDYPIYAKVIKYDEKKDLCLLSDPFFNNVLPALHLSDTEPVLQDLLHVVGFPAFSRAGLVIYETGRFQGVINNPGQADSHIINGHILPGSSGSPVMNGLGQVVGVIHAYYPSNQYPVYISLKDLKEFLNVK